MRGWKSLHGVTTDLNRRFLEHKDLKGGHYTSSHKVLERIYSEQHPNQSLALKRERQIKGWRRDKKLALINMST